MIRSALFLAATTLLVACGSDDSEDLVAGDTDTEATDDGGGPVSEAAFTADFVDLYCAAWSSCNTSGDACPISVDDTSDPAADCTYDPDQGGLCLEGEYTCDDTLGEGLEYVLPPEACSAVYDCPETT